MAPQKRSILELLQKLVRQHTFLSIEPNNVLFCKSCGQTIHYDRSHLAHRIASHINSKAHKDKHTRALTDGSSVTINRCLNFPPSDSAQKEFQADLVRAMVASNIPINKLNCEPFNSFLKKYISHRIPSANSIRGSELDDLFDKTIKRVRQVIGNNDVCFFIDETTDRCGRHQVNVLVSSLNGEEWDPMLIHVAFVETCDSAMINKVFINACEILWDSRDFPVERVKLLVSDQAAYMLAAGKLIKCLCKQMMHVTCVAHCINRVAQVLREKHPQVDSFIGLFKLILKNNLARINKFKEMTGLKLPPKPTIIRWTTWLQSAQFLAANFSDIERFIKSLKSRCDRVQRLKELLHCRLLSRELLSLTDYWFLIDSTVQLQRKSMKLEDAWSILNSVGCKLDEASCKPAKDKFWLSLDKNPDIRNMLECTDIAFRLKMKYAPIVSVDVERSFSVTKSVLSSERCSFTEQNLVKNYIILVNKRLTE